MAGQIFKPVGSAQVHMDGCVLIVHTSGHWNLEQRRQHDAQVAPFTGFLAANGDWGVVVVPLDTVVTQLDVIAEGAKATAEAAAYGLKAIAWVFPAEIEGAGLLKETYRRHFGVAIATEFFDTSAQAIAWVRAQVGANAP